MENTSLTQAQKLLVKEFLWKHHKVIGIDKIDLVVTPTVEHEIDNQGSHLIKHRYRRFAPATQAEIKLELEKLLCEGIIELPLGVAFNTRWQE